MTLLVLLAALAIVPGEAPKTQWMVVVTDSWTSDRGTARIVENGQTVLGPIEVRVGHAGLGWGVGLHPTKRPKGPVKVEGDGRSPAGMFRVGPTWTRFWSGRSFCVDDKEAEDYGRIVTLSSDQKERWDSAEHMSDYRVAVEIAHNPGRKKGGGSCIFLHDGTEPTVGCTAFDRPVMDAVRARLRKGATMVQLPRSVYDEVRSAWRLPALSPGP